MKRIIQDEYHELVGTQHKKMGSKIMEVKEIRERGPNGMTRITREMKLMNGIEIKEKEYLKPETIQKLDKAREERRRRLRLMSSSGDDNNNNNNNDNDKPASGGGGGGGGGASSSKVRGRVKIEPPKRTSTAGWNAIVGQEHKPTSIGPSGGGWSSGITAKKSAAAAAAAAVPEKEEEQEEEEEETEPEVPITENDGDNNDVSSLLKKKRKNNNGSMDTITHNNNNNNNNIDSDDEIPKGSISTRCMEMLSSMHSKNDDDNDDDDDDYYEEEEQQQQQQSSVAVGDDDDENDDENDFAAEKDPPSVHDDDDNDNNDDEEVVGKQQQYAEEEDDDGNEQQQRERTIVVPKEEEEGETAASTAAAIAIPEAERIAKEKEAAAMEAERIAKEREVAALEAEKNAKRREVETEAERTRMIQKDQAADAERMQRRQEEELERRDVQEEEERRIAQSKQIEAAEKLAREKHDEAQRLAEEKAEMERIAKLNEERIGKEKEEAQKFAEEKQAELQRLAEGKAEAERIAKVNEVRLEAERILKERQAEEAKMAQQQAELERTSREQAEADRLRAEREVLAAQQKAEQERIARENAERESRRAIEELRVLKQQAQEERIARENAERERLRLEEESRIVQQMADADRIAKEKQIEAERIALEKAREEEARKKVEQEALAAKEKAEQERLAREKAQEELRILKETADKERIARENAERERLRVEEEARIVRENAKKDRLRMEEEARIAKEIAEKERREVEEEARIAKESAEKERLKAQEEARIAKEKADSKRIARETAKAERIEAERIAKGHPDADCVTIEIELDDLKGEDESSGSGGGGGGGKNHHSMNSISLSTSLHSHSSSYSPHSSFNESFGSIAKKKGNRDKKDRSKSPTSRKKKKKKKDTEGSNVEANIDSSEHKKLKRKKKKKTDLSASTTSIPTIKKKKKKKDNDLSKSFSSIPNNFNSSMNSSFHDSFSSSRDFWAEKEKEGTGTKDKTTTSKPKLPPSSSSSSPKTKRQSAATAVQESSPGKKKGTKKASKKTIPSKPPISPGKSRKQKISLADKPVDEPSESEVSEMELADFVPESTPGKPKTTLGKSFHTAMDLWKAKERKLRKKKKKEEMPKHPNTSSPRKPKKSAAEVLAKYAVPKVPFDPSIQPTQKQLSEKGSTKPTSKIPKDESPPKAYSSDSQSSRPYDERNSQSQKRHGSKKPPPPPVAPPFSPVPEHEVKSAHTADHQNHPSTPTNDNNDHTIIDKPMNEVSRPPMTPETHNNHDVAARTSPGSPISKSPTKSIDDSPTKSPSSRKSKVSGLAGMQLKRQEKAKKEKEKRETDAKDKKDKKDKKKDKDKKDKKEKDKKEKEKDKKSKKSKKDAAKEVAATEDVHDILKHMETKSKAEVSSDEDNGEASGANDLDTRKSISEDSEIKSMEEDAEIGQLDASTDAQPTKSSKDNIKATSDITNLVSIWKKKEKATGAYPAPIEAAPQQSTRQGQKFAKWKDTLRRLNESRDAQNRAKPIPAPPLRFKNIQGETLQSPKKSYKPPVFKKSVEEVDLIEESVSENPAFKGIVKSAQMALIDAFEKVEYTKGSTVAEEGAPENKLFVVQDGEVSFHNRGVQIGSGSAGSTFGEMALRYPGPRPVEVKAESDSTVLFQLDHTSYRNILRHEIDREEEIRTKLLRAVPFFKDADDSDLKQLGAAMKAHHFKKDENLTASFAEAPFCLVQKGSLSIKDLDQDENDLMGYLLGGGGGTEVGPGEVFGEQVLSTKDAKRLHIQALSDGIACTITRSGFEKVFGDMERLLGKARDKKILSGIKPIKVAKLSDPDMDALVRQISNVNFEADNDIFTNNKEMTPALYLVRMGKVEITKKNGTKETKVAGDFFGHEYLLTISKGGRDTVPTSVRAKNTATPLVNSVCGILTLQELAAITTGSTKKPDLEQTTFVPVEDLVRHRILGEGQFGVVWLVTNKHATTVEPYALKIQKIDDPDRPDAVDSIREEVNVMRALQCPFIVQVLSTYDEPESISMLLTLAPGGELFDIVHQEDESGDWHSGLQEHVAAFYATVVVDAMAFMHHQRYIYRDLKPENVLIDRHGYPVITDFGFAKHLGGKSRAKTYTFCGTPQYICPEIASNSGHSYPADNWTLGILIYELILGDNPFYEDGVDHILLYDSVCNDPPYYDPEDVISPEAKDLIDRLLEKDPNKRLGTFREKDIIEHRWLSQYKLSELRAKKVQSPWVPDPVELED